MPNMPHRIMKMAQPVCPPSYSHAAAPSQISVAPTTGTIEKKNVATRSSGTPGTSAMMKPIIATSARVAAVPTMPTMTPVTVFSASLSMRSPRSPRQLAAGTQCIGVVFRVAGR